VLVAAALLVMAALPILYLFSWVITTITELVAAALSNVLSRTVCPSDVSAAHACESSGPLTMPARY
jgi:uncharacterized protein involved in cysteine biosynthesis